MPQEISPNDLQALKLLDYIAGRFEADAGFPLPGISTNEILPSLASRFEAGELSEERMAALAERGFLARSFALVGSRPIYALTETAEKIARAA